LAQLVDALRLANQSAESGAIGRSATLHGAELLKMGLTLGQVVHGYGDVCQAVTELAEETHAPITVEEFHTLNRCLDDAIAQAVTEHARLTEMSRREGETRRSGEFARELRNRLSATTLAWDILRNGHVAVNGNVGAIVSRNLASLVALLNRSLLEVRMDARHEQRQQVAVSELVEEAASDGGGEADSLHVSLSVTPADSRLYVDVDRHIVSGALGNLLHSAFKFTKPGGHVSLQTSATPSRVQIDVADECGGLPTGKCEELAAACEQRGADRSGLGLGLFITRKAVEASGGVLRVRDVPGTGCVFTIDLPRVASDRIDRLRQS